MGIGAYVSPQLAAAGHSVRLPVVGRGRLGLATVAPGCISWANMADQGAVEGGGGGQSPGEQLQVAEPWLLGRRSLTPSSTPLNAALDADAGTREEV